MLVQAIVKLLDFASFAFLFRSTYHHAKEACEDAQTFLREEMVARKTECGCRTAGSSSAQAFGEDT